MENSNKKKVIIIGAGISGMTAGIYALDNGYDVTIYERHSIVGGQCTGWDRKGAYIDGCAHWIVGTNPNSDFYPIWRHLGAFDSNTTIFETEYFTKFDIDGEVVTFYADLEKLEQEFLRVAPEDKRQIRRFINGIKAYKFTKVPTKKPLDHMNIFEWMVYGIQLLPMAFHFAYYKHTSVKHYAKKFKSPILKEVFRRFMNGKYNIHSLVYIMKSLAMRDAGIQVSFKLTKPLFAYPKMVNFAIKPYKLANMTIDNITIRNHSFDNTLNKSGATLTVLLHSNDSVYSFLSALGRKDYLKEKEKLGLHLLDEICKYVKLTNEDIELIDVSTPLTYERYTNAYHGSYMSFITTRKSKGLMRKGLIKGLNNFAMAGQWIMSPGGLPIALFSGKFAAIRICKMDNKKFVDLDYQYTSKYNKNGLRAS